MNRIFTVVACCCLTTSPLLADNWPHWRGADGNGVANDASPPTQWSSTQNVKWKVEIPGRGSGSPVIWNDQVFVVTAVQVGGQAAAAQQGQQPNARPGGGRPVVGRVVVGRVVAVDRDVELLRDRFRICSSS